MCIYIYTYISIVGRSPSKKEAPAEFIPATSAALPKFLHIDTWKGTTTAWMVVETCATHGM